MEKKNKLATIGLVVMGTGLIYGIAAGGSNPQNRSPFYIGTGAFVVGTGMMLAFRIKDDDVYRFLNLHNKYSPEEKMEWEIGLNIMPQGTIGCGLVMKF